MMHTRGVLVMLTIGTIMAGVSCGDDVTLAEVSTFQFDTRDLFGEIRGVGPIFRDLPKPGVVMCRHKPSGTDILPYVPFHALLMPEWLLRPGEPRQGIFWDPLNVDAAMSIEARSVVFRVAAEQTKSWGMSAEFRYTAGPDWVDLDLVLTPTKNITGFEFLFASYIANRFDESWMPIVTEHGESWRKLDRGELKHGCQVPGSVKARAYLTDGRWAGTPELEQGIIDRPAWNYARPILIALERRTGLAVVTMVDPGACTMLPMQHHAEETAHDFTVGGDLVGGTAFRAKARILVRSLGDFPEDRSALETAWAEFLESLEAR